MGRRAVREGIKYGMRSEDYAHLYALEEDFWWFEGMREITSHCSTRCLPAGKIDILDAGCGTGGIARD